MNSQMLTTCAAATVLLLAIPAGSAAAAAAHDDNLGPVNREPWSTKARSTINRHELAQPFEVREVDGATTATLEALEVSSVDLLMQAIESPNPLLRANALEALSVRSQYVEGPVRNALNDENRGVRFVAAMIVGRSQLHNVVEDVQPLLDDQSQSVQAAAMFALHRCGWQIDITPLAEMVLSEDPEVKGNAAMVLGELGDRSAVPLLKTAARRALTNVGSLRQRIVDLQIAEALVRLGERDELEVIHAALFSPAELGELTALACQVLGRVNDARALPNLQDLATREGREQQPADVRLAAAGAIAVIAPEQVPVDMVLEFVDSERYPLRAHAAAVLGYVNSEDGAAALATLLGDSNPLVQVSAAGGLLRTAAAAD